MTYMTAMNLEVVIYGSDGCHWCVTAKEFFTKRDIKFEYKDVRNQENLEEMLEVNGGQEAIPTIVIGDLFTIGAGEDKLEAMLKEALKASDESE